MKKKYLALFAVAAIVSVVTVFLFAGCTKQDESWRTNALFDLSLPNLEGAEGGSANADGWYLTLLDDFDGTTLNGTTKVWNSDGSARAVDDNENRVWTYSPHARRSKTNDENRPEWASYWCDDMVEVKDGCVRVSARAEENHVCSNGKCKATAGRFTGGFETREVVGDPSDNQGTSDNLLFSQAYGYFECKVQFPNAEGLWSAFWLQSSNQRKLASEGVDGTEIDVFESAFIKNPTQMGNALLWNGYDAAKGAKVDGYINDTDKNLYDGFHTFALKWTPEYYVFYVDGVPNWASNGGGVARVKEFLRFTVEIDNGDAWGPHGQKIGQFRDNNSVFLVDSIRVYQNKNFERYIIDDESFPGDLDLAN